jgi:hypothetical protein
MEESDPKYHDSYGDIRVILQRLQLNMQSNATACATIVFSLA